VSLVEQQFSPLHKRFVSYNKIGKKLSIEKNTGEKYE